MEPFFKSNYIHVVNYMMATRQKILHLLYPLLRFFNSGKKDIKISAQAPVTSIYDLNLETTSGEIVSLSAFRGKKLLLVNIASECGYTRQLEGLEELSKNYNNLQLLAFPSNDFRGQEPLSNEQIADFCRLNYGISFPVAKKSSVKKSSEQNPVFRWLTSSQLNGWNDDPPLWNFSKYLVNENGSLVAVTGPATDPLSKELKALL